MSYPQAPASQEVNESQEFYRLKTILDSSGDAYEMDISALAFAVGPESDVARFRVTYLDPVNDAQSFVVSVGSPFVGRIDALASKKYQGGNPGVIILTPEDVVEDLSAVITPYVGIDATRDIIGFVKPRMDILAYLSNPPALPSKRADFIQRGIFSVKNHVADNFSGNGTSYLFVPYYRRKYASLKVRNDISGGSPYTIKIRGISFVPASRTSDGGVARVQSTELISVGVGAGAVASPEIRSSSYGMWDYLGISIAGESHDSSVINNGMLSYTLELLDEEA